MSVLDPARKSPLGPAEPPVIAPGHSPASVTDKISSVVLGRMPLWFYAAMGVAFLGTLMLLGSLTKLVFTGIGIWGNNQPVGWAFDIINFVWWIGIGHAGTLISAILFLFRQRWRTSINRFAESMTIFAVICAGLFPAIHVGRIWVLQWVFPLPYSQGAWPNFRSPLLWDVFAVGTYMLVSMMFWYMGMVPDLATLRDRAKTKTRWLIYGLLSLGWRSSNRHWHRFEKAYLLLAGLATPLVLSVHSVVSFDFAVSQVPGWHTTIFPPYFVAGAIFGGFAMVATIIIPVRRLFGLQDLITPRHLENMAKIMLATGMMVGYAYAIEFFMAWYSGNAFESFTFVNRALGPYAWAYWIMISCNVLIPQLFWSRRLRRNLSVMWLVAVLVNVGMWFERFVIIVTSLSRDYLPSAWGLYAPTWVEILTLIGSFGLFLTLFLIFMRFAPIVAMAEVKTVMPEARLAEAHAGAGDYWGDIPGRYDREKPQ